jgi:hypothetical protein
MSKIFTILIIILLLGAVYYVYDTNTNNVGMKIDKLKLKYTLEDNASPESILLFSQELSSLSKEETDLDKSRLEFESSFWLALGNVKDLTWKINSYKSLEAYCDAEVKDFKNLANIAKSNLNIAKQKYLVAQTAYDNLQKQDFELKLENVEYNLQVNEDLLYIYCPE